MQILADACLALLASVGLWTLGKMAFNWFLPNWAKPEMMVVIRVRGDGNRLERSLETLLSKPHGSGVLIMDCGLTKDGLNKVNLLLEHYTDVEFCSCECLSSK